MGKKSEAMFKLVAPQLDAIKEQHAKCGELADYFRETLIEFIDAPLLSDRRKQIYEHMKGVSFKLLPLVTSLQSQIRNVDGPLAAFERFLIAKKRAHKDDWTNLEKTSLGQFWDFVAEARPELEAARERCSAIPGFVSDALDHCKQA